MKSIFLNGHGRLRSGWRAAVFLFSFLIFASLFILAAITVLNSFFDGKEPRYLALVVPFGISTIIAIVLGWVYGRLFDGVPFRALGCSISSGALRHLAIGICAGVSAFLVAVVLTLAAGGIRLAMNAEAAGSAIASTLGTSLVVFVVGAASEETLFRGYLLQTLSRARLLWLGVVVSSLLFALGHNNNPEVTGLSLVNTFLAGGWFGVAYYRSRDLWLPFGMHVAWNWLQGPIFGISVSGISDMTPAPMMKATDLGPVWLTGGAYGIEGGVACTIALIIATGLTFYLPGIKADEEVVRLSTEERPAKLPSPPVS